MTLRALVMSLSCYGALEIVGLLLLLLLTAQTSPFSAFCTAIHSFTTGEPRDFKLDTLTYHSKSHSADEKSSLKGGWSGSRKQFLH